MGIWLLPSINRLPNYDDIIKRLQQGEILLDVGCFLGHDLRRLVFDGAPAANLRAVDLVSHWDVGYELFRDRDRFSVQFAEADVLDEHNAQLAAWRGKLDIISIFHVLHQWLWEDQVLACKRLVALLAARPGSMVVGCQIGNVKGCVWSLRDSSSPDYSPQYRHTPETFAKLWDQVGRETGSRWHTQAWLHTWPQMGWYAEDLTWLEDGARAIDFVVTRQA